jgi:F-type H+-transporting ATPase subunit alpha
MELLKQPLGKPYAMHEQVILLVCANAGKLDFVPVNQVKDYKTKLLKYFADNKKDIIEDISKSLDLSDGTKKAILEGADEFEKINNEALKQELKKKRKKLVLD